ncbi:MAG: gliding motility-associated C-terminal domain-containing protein [Saprospiraceae bacterium]|nr:gliding motility-associated C-terminal domain-containing protein [Lewinella sp.]
MATNKLYQLLLSAFLLTASPILLTAQNGCDVTVDAGENKTFCESDQNVTLTGLIVGDFLDLQWEPAAGLSAPNLATTQALVNTTTTYTLTVRSRSSLNLITNGDFSQGDTGFTSDYTYGTGGSLGLLTSEGQYAIDDNPQDTHRRFADCGDHTTGTGNMMVVNASGEEDSFWCQSITVNEGTSYDFSAWMTSVNDENPAQLQFSIDGNLLGDQFNATANLCAWMEFSAQWTAPASAEVEICIVNVNLTPAGNDFALDDIAFQEICETTDSVTITIADLNATWTPPSQICKDDDIIILNDLLHAEATPDGTWTLDGQTVTSLDPAQLNPGQYTLRYAVSLDQCGASREEPITVVKPPYAGSPGPTLRYCEGTEATVILANQLENEDPDGEWRETSLTSGPAGSFNPISSSLEIADLPAGDYTFNYTVGANSPCGSSENQVRVIIEALPTVNLGTDLVLDCANPTLTLSSDLDATYNFQWTDDAGNLLGTSSVLTVDAEGTYTLNVVSSTTSCQAQGSVSVTEIEGNTITASLEVTPPSCFDSNDGRISVVNPSGGLTPYLFSIDNKPFIDYPEFQNLPPGNYEIAVMDAGGCTEVFSAVITAPSELQVVIAAEKTILSLGDSLQLEAIVNNRISELSWIPNPASCSDCPLITVQPQQSTRYVVNVVDEFGCRASAQLDVQVKRDYNIFIPNAFSPNEDGVNDVFYINAAEGIRLLHLEVVDRWGNVVFQRNDLAANDPGSAWDGRFRGILVPSGVMVYALEAELASGERVILSGELAVVY